MRVSACRMDPQKCIFEVGSSSKLDSCLIRVRHFEIEGAALTSREVGPSKRWIHRDSNVVSGHRKGVCFTHVCEPVVLATCLHACAGAFRKRGKQTESAPSNGAQLTKLEKLKNMLAAGKRKREVEKAEAKASQAEGSKEKKKDAALCIGGPAKEMAPATRQELQGLVNEIEEALAEPVKLEKEEQKEKKKSKKEKKEKKEQPTSTPEAKAVDISASKKEKKRKPADEAIADSLCPVATLRVRACCVTCLGLRRSQKKKRFPRKQLPLQQPVMKQP